MEEAPENSKESSNFAHTNGMNDVKEEPHQRLQEFNWLAFLN